ncbi:MAG: penicillin-binding protein [Nitrospirae bacterium]|nr:penicillin-binding protein [Nitrospirota bacterium]
MPLATNPRGPQARRILVVMTGLVLLYVLVAFRLFSVMVLSGPELAKKAERQHQKVVLLEPRRGSILDRAGRELAVSVEVESLYGVPSEIENPHRVASLLSRALGVPSAQLERRLDSSRHFAWIERKLDPERVERVKGLGLLQREVGFLTESRRFYPKRRLASHVLGFQGLDGQGLEGIERRHEEALKGEKGLLVAEKDALGRTIVSGDRNFRPPIAGHDLLLTIDEGIQHIVERELDSLMAEYRPRGAVGIVLDPRTGEFLALAVRPEFNPNAVSEHRPGDWRNRAVTDAFEPGSTMKMFLAAAALEEGIVTPEQTFDVSEGVVEVSGRKIHDLHRYGRLTFAEILKKSSNVGAVKVGLKLGAERYHRSLKAFGFGEKTGIDLPGESAGILHPLKSWTVHTLPSAAIGQEVGVTPVQLAVAAAAVANGGVLMRPYLVSEIRSAGGETLRRFGPTEIRRVVSEETARKLARILSGATEEGGTGRQAALGDLKVAGKTGTAQKVNPQTGRYSATAYVSSFVGFVPADDPRLLVLVVVDEPRGKIYGGEVAAPAFRRIVEPALTLLGVPPARPGSVVTVAMGTKNPGESVNR